MVFPDKSTVCSAGNADQPEAEPEPIPNTVDISWDDDI